MRAPIERELLLAKVSILGPEYVEYQYQGGPTHEPRRADAREDKLEREASLVHNFEQSARPDAETTPAPLTPSQLLRMKSDHLQSISILAAQFDARMVDVSEHSVIVGEQDGVAPPTPRSPMRSPTAPTASAPGSPSMPRSATMPILPPPKSSSLMVPQAGLGGVLQRTRSLSLSRRASTAPIMSSACACSRSRPS